jgi:hypothetical protein
MRGGKGLSIIVGVREVGGFHKTHTKGEGRTSGKVYLSNLLPPIWYGNKGQAPPLSQGSGAAGQADGGNPYPYPYPMPAARGGGATSAS